MGRITMQKCAGTLRPVPALYSVLLDGHPIKRDAWGHSACRVLRSPWGYLAVVDGAESDVRLMRSFVRRADAAALAVEVARDYGLL